MKIPVDITSSATRWMGLSSLQEALPQDGGRSPEVGDIVLAQVKSIGRHTVIELPDGNERALKVGEVVAVALGRRYATDEFHGEVPSTLSEGGVLHLLNVGGVAGKVKKSTSTISHPTTMAYLGTAVDEKGIKLTTFRHRLTIGNPDKKIDVVLIVGSAMDVGKTTAAAEAIHTLAGGGFPVGGAKLTGTSRMKDILKMRRAGALAVVDFLDAGYPSTFGCSEKELEDIFFLMLDYLSGSGARVAVVEVADGIFQRETEMILSSARIMKRVGMIVAAASDSLSAYGLVHYLTNTYNRAPDFITGLLAASPLGVREFREKSNIPILLNTEKMSSRFIKRAREVFLYVD